MSLTYDRKKLDEKVDRMMAALVQNLNRNAMRDELVPRALALAEKYHQGQKRKGLGTPYINHPRAVGKILEGLSCPPEIVAAGILHDVLEDGPKYSKRSSEEIREDIRASFPSWGDWMIARVEEASEPDHDNPDWEARKRQTIEYVRSAAPEEILPVILADKLDNVRSIREGLRLVGDALWKEFKPEELSISERRAKQRSYYESLGAAFRARVKVGTLARLAQEFAIEVQETFQGGSR